MENFIVVYFEKRIIIAKTGVILPVIQAAGILVSRRAEGTSREKAGKNMYTPRRYSFIKTDRIASVAYQELLDTQCDAAPQSELFIIQTKFERVL